MTTARGFTLIETLLVVFLMGIATTVAVPVWHSVSREAQLDGAAAWLMGDIRYAQSLAIRSQKLHTMPFNVVNDTYRIADQTGTTVQHPLKKQAYQVTFATQRQLQGVDLVSATFGASATLSFDGLGAPQSGGTLTLSHAGRQRIITVTYPTGRVTVQ